MTTTRRNREPSILLSPAVQLSRPLSGLLVCNRGFDRIRTPIELKQPHRLAFSARNETICRRRLADGKTSRFNSFDLSTTRRVFELLHQILLQRISKGRSTQSPPNGPKRSARPISFDTCYDQVLTSTIGFWPTREQGDVDISF